MIKMYPVIGHAKECPVKPEARVYPIYRDGTISKIRRAGDLRWQHMDLPDDIMSYTIAKR